MPTKLAAQQHGRFWGACLVALVLLLGVQAAPASAQGVVRNSFGDWQLRCETPAGAQSEQCYLIQNVAAEDRPNVTLLIIALKTADKKNRILRVVAPLGIILPAGLSIKIDSTDLGKAGFVRCLTTGCMAEIDISSELLQQLRSGKQAIFSMFLTVEDGIGIVVSLDGFGAGFDALP